MRVTSGNGRRSGDGYAHAVPTLRLFAQARISAGTGHDEVPGSTVGAVLDAAAARYGATFAEVLPLCKVWVNGDEADRTTAVVDSDEVAVLPPVSGGHA
jgi:sulfur-carrier protein